MELIRRLEPLWLALVMLGGITWAVVALFDTNIVTEVVGDGTPADVVYVLFGLGALMFVPRLVEDLRPLAHRSHPHGA
ncbi:MAG: DUF378 domain-containing protein [Solirubrobacterales bacterium]|nr:DUF378 domain-containing protein [Solirubrobacterales bacterium]